MLSQVLKRKYMNMPGKSGAALTPEGRNQRCYYVQRIIPTITVTERIFDAAEGEKKKFVTLGEKKS